MLQSRQRRSRTNPRIVVIGAGIGGLAAAIDLAASGLAVTLLEKHAAPGGKMREHDVGPFHLDAGPTVFTMRWVFESLFRDAGSEFSDCVSAKPADVLARHGWLDGDRLDLFADVERSVEAIKQLSGAREGEAYRRFARQSEQMFETLDHSFMRSERPGPIGLTRSLGLSGLPRLYATKPFTSMWRELGHIFRDPRLQQLFGRYATYCGSSPFAAPATLMLIAHAERSGVWLIDGGMQRLAEAMAALAVGLGVEIRYGSDVAAIQVKQDRATGVRTREGENIGADAVVFNGDVNALTQGLLGDGVRKAVATRDGQPRSLSAVTWSLAGRAEGFPLHYHTVLFGSDYPDEFASIFDRDTTTAEPTVYICAKHRMNLAAPDDEEPLFLLVNAPPRKFEAAEIAQLEDKTFALLRRHGLEISERPGSRVVTTPNTFAERFPGTEGAIYGWPTHGWSGSFQRHGSRARVAGLYLAGGTVHPGPGVPMVAQSGRIAAAAVRQDLGVL